MASTFVAAPFGFAQARERVSRFADCVMVSTSVFGVDRRIAVTKLAGVFDLGGKMREFLEQMLADQRRVPARAAAVMTMRCTERNSASDMFNPPNFAVLASRSMRPRKAFSMVRGSRRFP